MKIVDLARQMIRLAGLEPDRDIEIVFTGLRAGEKLSERLFESDEPLQPSPVPGVLTAAPSPVPLDTINGFLDLLAELAAAGDGSELKGLLDQARSGALPAVAPSLLRQRRLRPA